MIEFGSKGHWLYQPQDTWTESKPSEDNLPSYEELAEAKRRLNGYPVGEQQPIEIQKEFYLRNLGEAHDNAWKAMKSTEGEESIIRLRTSTVQEHIVSFYECLSELHNDEV